MKRLLWLIILIAGCSQKPNPIVVWPPAPGYEESQYPILDAGKLE